LERGRERERKRKRREREVEDKVRDTLTRVRFGVVGCSQFCSQAAAVLEILRWPTGNMCQLTLKGPILMGVRIETGGIPA
jgi:hypothetical protein